MVSPGVRTVLRWLLRVVLMAVAVAVYLGGCVSVMPWLSAQVMQMAVFLVTAFLGLLMLLLLGLLLWLAWKVGGLL